MRNTRASTKKRVVVGSSDSAMYAVTVARATRRRDSREADRDVCDCAVDVCNCVSVTVSLDGRRDTRPRARAGVRAGAASLDTLEVSSEVIRSGDPIAEDIFLSVTSVTNFTMKAEAEPELAAPTEFCSSFGGPTARRRRARSGATAFVSELAHAVQAPQLHSSTRGAASPLSLTSTYEHIPRVGCAAILAVRSGEGEQPAAEG